MIITIKSNPIPTIIPTTNVWCDEDPELDELSEPEDGVTLFGEFEIEE